MKQTKHSIKSHRHELVHGADADFGRLSGEIWRWPLRLMCIHAPIGKKDRSYFVFHPIDGNPTGSSIGAPQPIADSGFGQH
jgi:hypothetical protein